jgi:hypothetical protein
VGASFGAGDGVDFVDDDVLDALEDLARLAGEDEVQAFGGGDEDVGRAAYELASFLPARRAAKVEPVVALRCE